jgi:nicotinamide-nucleotide amidase
VIFSGGLGPTEDDLTREAVAEALGVAVRRDEDVLARLSNSAFAARGWKMSANNTKQADVLEGATVSAQRERHRARAMAERKV